MKARQNRSKRTQAGSFLIEGNKMTSLCVFILFFLVKGRYIVESAGFGVFLITV